MVYIKSYYTRPEPAKTYNYKNCKLTALLSAYSGKYITVQAGKGVSKTYTGILTEINPDSITLITGMEPRQIHRNERITKTVITIEHISAVIVQYV